MMKVTISTIFPCELSQQIMSCFQNLIQKWMKQDSLTLTLQGNTDHPRTRPSQGE